MSKESLNKERAKPKIIAEVGSNFKNLTDCIKSVELAKQAGADFVKFQLFTPKELYGFTPKNMKDKSKLSRKWIPLIHQACIQNGIEFMCSAFSREGYDFINQFVNNHKIASAEVSSPELILKLAEFKKPVFLSSAGSTPNEIMKYIEPLKSCDKVVFYCVGDYPSKTIDPFGLYKLQTELKGSCMYGFSDHSIDVMIIPKYFSSLVHYIEKHVNFFDYKDTADVGHSLNFKEFKLMIDNIHDRYTQPQLDELMNVEMIRKHKRRLLEHGWFREY